MCSSDLLPRSQSLKDVPSRFQLNELSHIAPGLKTIYSQRFNVNEGNKTFPRYSGESLFADPILTSRLFFSCIVHDFHFHSAVFPVPQVDRNACYSAGTRPKNGGKETSGDGPTICRVSANSIS